MCEKSKNTIPRIDFGPNPFLTQDGCRRAAAELETERDLQKDPKQLLADIHDETLNFRSDSVARCLARLASLELRTQDLAEDLNRKIRLITYWGFVFGALGVLFTGIQTIPVILDLYRTYHNASKDELEKQQIPSKSPVENSESKHNTTETTAPRK